MSSDKEILAILIPGFPGSEDDTICLPAQQSFVYHLQQSMPQVNVVVLTFHYPYHHQPYKWKGIQVIPFSGKNKGGIAGYLMRRKIDSVLKQFHHKHKIKAVLSFWYGECAYVGQVFSKKTGVPHYCWIRGQDAREDNHYPGKLRMRPDQLIGLSDFLQDEFEKNHGVRPQWMIPQGIDPKNFAAYDQERNIELLAVGSLIPLKRLEIFIDVVAEVKKQFPLVRSVIIGKGAERERLEKLAEEKGSKENIQFVGELSYPEVIHYMQRSKILLHPSSYEGFSGVCLEALAAGARVISFCRAMKENVEGWNIVGNTEEMIAKAIEVLFKNGTFKSVFPFRIESSITEIKKTLRI